MSSITRMSAWAEVALTWAYSSCSSLSSVPEQQLGHAQHAVERGADLVAHVGHELGLQPGGRQRLLAALAQTLFHLAALGDIARGGVDVAVVEHGGAPEQPAVGAIAAAVAVLEREHLAAAGLAAERLLGGGDVIGMDEVHVRAAGELLARVAEDRLERRIDAHEVTVGVGDRHQVERQGEEAVDLGPGLRELLLGVLALGDVLDLGDEVERRSSSSRASDTDSRAHTRWPSWCR